MIQLEDAESVVRDHLKRLPDPPNGPKNDQDTTAHHPNSEAMITELPHSASNSKFKIVDLGVGMSRTDLHIPKAERRG